MRERRTDGFDAKINYQVSPKDQVSVRYSFLRPTGWSRATSPNDFGGPYQGGFVGTGVNTTLERRPATGCARGPTRS